MSSYVLEELNYALVETGSLTIVDRRNIGVLQDELEFQYSGEVSDETASLIGRKLGAQMIVSGAVGIAGNVYRYRVQVLDVETAAIKHSSRSNIKNDEVTMALMSGQIIIRDFSIYERLATASLNLVVGMGAFLVQHDFKSGGTVAGWESVGLVAMVTSGILYSRGIFDKLEKNDIFDRQVRPPLNKSYAAIPFYIGLACYSGGALYGVVRAFNYNKPGSIGDKPELESVNISLVPDYMGNPALALSYTMRF
jgi:hypothetical protein